MYFMKILTFLFFLFKTNDATIKIVNIATNFCLESNRIKDVFSNECNKGEFQNWIRLNEEYIGIIYDVNYLI
jgi:hypothetical protein